MSQFVAKIGFGRCFVKPAELLFTASVTKASFSFESVLKNSKATSYQSSTSGNETQPLSKDKRQWKWKKPTTELKVIATLLVGVVSYLTSNFNDKKRALKTVQLEYVNEQMKKLYGPLYGNRLIEKKTYQAVVGNYGNLKNYLKQAREKNDSEMVQVWRNYVRHVLYPLDKQAEDLICQNSQLIADNEFPPGFDSFLTHIAKLKFVMEHWDSNDCLKSSKKLCPEDFSVECNTSGSRAVKEMLEHVETRFKELKELQTKLKVEVKIENTSRDNLNNFVKKFTRL